MTDYELPPDISARIEQDFGDGAVEGIRSLLRPVLDQDLSDRVVRCILFLSSGDLDRLRHNVEQAVIDFRDGIYWAEYDASQRTFDFNLPFEEAALR